MQFDIDITLKIIKWCDDHGVYEESSRKELFAILESVLAPPSSSEWKHAYPDFRALRSARRLKLKKVSEDTGISHPYLSQLERGQFTNPGHDIIQVLKEYYNIE